MDALSPGLDERVIEVDRILVDELPSIIEAVKGVWSDQTRPVGDPSEPGGHPVRFPCDPLAHVSVTR